MASAEANDKKEGPISVAKLTEIASAACETALGDAKFYDHSKTHDWNNTIINTILDRCINETKTKKGPQYKFVCNSSIVQHTAPTEESDSDEEDDATLNGGEKKKEDKEFKPSGARRGMHSATAAFWDDARDGMWSYKYNGGASKGLDIIIMLVWIHI